MKRSPAFRLRTGTLRAARIAKGLKDPSTRPQYLASARRHARLRPKRRQGERCLVCGTSELERRTATYFRDKSLSCPVRICHRCGFVRCVKAERSHYLDMTDIAALPPSTRAGTTTRKGREFHMAQMAVDILDRHDVEVLVYGAGKSLDNHHIEALPNVSNVAIGDIMKLRDDAEFIDANEPPPRRFPVVIACEVIEHFRDPWSDFAKLLRLVDREGVVVCGTNITDGGNLDEDRYIYYPDHTAYYSPQSLRLIAKSFGYHLDFRSPGGATPRRKKYVIFSKSPRTMERVSDYFGSHEHAPAEPLPPKKKPRPAPGKVQAAS